MSAVAQALHIEIAADERHLIARQPVRCTEDNRVGMCQSFVVMFFIVTSLFEVTAWSKTV